MRNKYSILYPEGIDDYKVISPVVLHDLGLDVICKKLSAKEAEQNLIMNIMSKLSANPKVARYRVDVFEDIIHHKKMRDDMMEVLGKISFLKEYGGFTREYDENSSVWDLLHRLDELNDYIKCVDALFECLSSSELKSEGLKGLYSYVDAIYKDNGFAELKRDIEELKFDTSQLKSVTVGINLNSRFEADGIGLVSINDRYYTKSGVISNFCDHISNKDNVINDKDINNTNNKNKSYTFKPFSSAEVSGAIDTAEHWIKTAMASTNAVVAASGVMNLAEKDQTKDITRYMDRIVNHMLSGIVKHLKGVLNRYVSVTITDMTDLIPEFMFYIRWAEYIESLRDKGYQFEKPVVDSQNIASMKAKDVYNIKLVDGCQPKDIVANDLEYNDRTRVYILTGANRGGKTTITQTVGQLFIMAQAGIYVAGKEFIFSPVDSIFTHFPADEDKTMDLGRLGEECKRFREMYMEATDKSLLLLNETFSTTSFEEGYYIAKDSVRAILNKGIRSLYNTHMHKLAYDIDDINQVSQYNEAKSLIVMAQDGERSYKVAIAPPQGKSYAEDIAKKYGVTYELLVNDKE